MPYLHQWLQSVLLSRTWDSRTRTRTWKLVHEDPRGQALSSRTTHRVSNKRPRLLDIQSCQSASHYVITTPALTPAQSADTDGLLSPRKFSRTWTSEDEDMDKDLKIGPRGSSRTRTFLEHNNTGFSCLCCRPEDWSNFVRGAAMFSWSQDGEMRHWKLRRKCRVLLSNWLLQRS